MAYDAGKFGLEPPDMRFERSKPLTADDIEKRKRRLEMLGLDDTALGDINDLAGSVVHSRDAMKGAVRDAAMNSVGLSSGASGASLGAAAGEGMASMEAMAASL